MITYHMKCENKKCDFENPNYTCSISECDKQFCPKCGKKLKRKLVLCENGAIIYNPYMHGLDENGDE